MLLGFSLAGCGRFSGQCLRFLGGSRFYGERRFAQSHEWIDLETGEVGVSNYALSKAEVVYLELPEKGIHVSQGDEIGEIASVKSSSPLYSPMAGEIVDVNNELEDDLTSLNEGAKNEKMSDNPWIFKLNISDVSEFDSLMREEKYVEMVNELEDV